MLRHADSQYWVTAYVCVDKCERGFLLSPLGCQIDNAQHRSLLHALHVAGPVLPGRPRYLGQPTAVCTPAFRAAGRRSHVPVRQMRRYTGSAVWLG